MCLLLSCHSLDDPVAQARPKLADGKQQLRPCRHDEFALAHFARAQDSPGQPIWVDSFELYSATGPARLFRQVFGLGVVSLASIGAANRSGTNQQRMQA